MKILFIGKEDGDYDYEDFTYKLDIALSPALEMEKLVEEGNTNVSFFYCCFPP
jgi:hypothetical protein